MAAPLFKIRTDKDAEFTGAIAQNAGEDENLTFPGYASAAIGNLEAQARFWVRELRIWSDQNLSWEVQFYSKDIFDDTDADLDTFLGAHQFAVADGLQIGGSGLYRYVATGLSLFVKDGDGTGEVHVKLVNRSATSKNAGATGEVVLEIGAEYA